MSESMKQRIVSGAGIVLFFSAVVFFNDIFPIALNIVIALISAMCVYEIVKALQLQKKWFVSMPSLLVAAAMPFVPDGQYSFLVYCLYTALVFTAMIIYHRDITFKEVAVLYSMVVLIPCALRTLVSLRSLSESHGMFYVLVAFLAAWMSDVGAYFAGTFFGKHKLCPEISPKKTIEGLIGGVIFNILVVTFSGVFFAEIFYGGEKSVSYVVLLIIGLVGAFTSVLGDLSFSLIKRSCHIKDFGQMLPGHGGVLDRFDSIIFTAPFVYLLVAVFPIVM